VGALAVAGALAAACGQVLGLDGIDYDVGDGGAVAPGGDATTMTGADGSQSGGEDAGGDAGAMGGDGSAADQGSPPEDAAPPAPVTIATGPLAVKGVALDATRVYWVALGAGANSGSVLSVLKDGGGMTTIATNQTSPLDIAVLGTSVYWSVSITGTGPQCMAMVATTPGNAGPGGDAGPSCVLSSPDTTVRMTTGGGSDLVLLAQGTGAQANNEYVGFPAPAGTFTNVETQGQSQAIAATSTQGFLANNCCPHVDEISLPALGFGTTVCNTNCGSNTIVDMTIDVAAENVLWITSGGGVREAPILVSGGVGTELALLNAGAAATPPQRMARDESYVYVTTASQWVGAIPIAPGTDAGAYFALSSSEEQPFGIAVDGSGVYWGNANGAIRRAPLPAP
jgi:hypothetical protein